MNHCRVMLAVALGLSIPANAPAADSSTESRLRDALRAATSQVHALEDERARMQAVDTEQKKEIESLKAKLTAAQAAPPRTVIKRDDKEIAELKARLAEVTEALDKLNVSVAQCQAALNESSSSLRAGDEQRAQFSEKLGTLNDRVGDCEAKNAKMFEVAKEILGRYQNIGVGEVIRAREPFVGAKRVQLENLAQSYEDRLRDQQIRTNYLDPQSPPAPGN